jgi:hypothetical protein
MFMAMTFGAHYAISNFDDIEESTDAVGPFLTCLLGVVKLITFYCYQKEFIGLIAQLKDLIESQIINQELKVIKKMKRYDKILTSCYLWSCALTGSGYVIVGIWKNFISDIDELNRELPFKTS